MTAHSPSSTATGRRVQRDVLRERWNARVPRWYSPLAHLLLNAVVAAALVAWFAFELRTHGIRPLAVLVVPVALAFANALEHAVHRGPMHHRRRWFDGLFRRHTLQHHRFFTREHMEIRSRRELFFVLFPVQFGLMAVTGTVLAFVALRAAVHTDVAALAALTFVAYFLALEWLHLAFHLPSAWFERGPLRGRALRALREHHRIHHDPRLMSRFNFNITVPWTDRARGTVYGRARAPRPVTVPDGAAASDAALP